MRLAHTYSSNRRANIILEQTMKCHMSEFDEFAELDKELNEVNFEDFILQVEDGKIDSVFILQRQVQSAEPLRKIIGLIIAIPLIPIFGLGIYLMWNILNMGPINQHTKRIDAKIYSKSHHSIFDYRLISSQETPDYKITRTKIDLITHNAFIRLTKTWSDQMGSHRISCRIVNDKNSINLPYIESESSAYGSGIEQLFVGPRLEEFARFAKLKLETN